MTDTGTQHVINAQYGSWARAYRSSITTLADTVAAALTASGDLIPQSDIDRVAQAWRSAINTALPERVALHGDEFYGPAYPHAWEWEGYPVTEDGWLDFRAIIDGVDFWEIVARELGW